MNYLRVSIISFIFLILPVSLCFAQEEDESKESDPCDGSIEREAVQPATLAHFGATGNIAAIDVDISGASGDGSGSTFTASLNQLNSGKCKTVIKNNSECNEYRISFAVKEFDFRSDGKNVLSNTYYFKPGDSRDFKFRCKPQSRSYQVVITSAKPRQRR